MLDDTLKALIYMTSELPVGTNLGLLHVLWMLVSGALVANRGAVFGGLKSSGLSDEAIRRAWAALRYGQWRIEELVEGGHTSGRRRVGRRRRWKAIRR